MTCAAERIDARSIETMVRSTLPNTSSATVNNDNMTLSQESERLTENSNNVVNTKAGECHLTSDEYVNSEKQLVENDNINSNSENDEMNSDELDEFADYYVSKNNVRKVLFTNLPCNMLHGRHYENNERQENKETSPNELSTQKEEEENVIKHTLHENLRVHEMTIHRRRELHERKLQ